MASKADNKKMKELWKYLQQFYFFQNKYFNITMCCVDENNHIKHVEYNNLCDAFSAGEEILFIIHDPEGDDGEYFFIDKVKRSGKIVDPTHFTQNHNILIPYQRDTIVVTMKNEFKIKRFGVVEYTVNNESLFFENNLRSDVKEAMHAFIDEF